MGENLTKTLAEAVAVLDCKGVKKDTLRRVFLFGFRRLYAASTKDIEEVLLP